MIRRRGGGGAGRGALWWQGGWERFAGSEGEIKGGKINKTKGWLDMGAEVQGGNVGLELHAQVRLPGCVCVCRGRGGRGEGWGREVWSPSGASASYWLEEGLPAWSHEFCGSGRT